MTEDLKLSVSPTPTNEASGCACCAPVTSTSASAPASAPAAAIAGVGSDPVRTSYEVAGMTCGHCVGAVRSELSTLPGVHEVDIDLIAGGASTVTITSEAALERASVAAAIDEAGYELLAARS